MEENSAFLPLSPGRPPNATKPASQEAMQVPCSHSGCALAFSLSCSLEGGRPTVISVWLVCVCAHRKVFHSLHVASVSVSSFISSWQGKHQALPIIL